MKISSYKENTVQNIYISVHLLSPHTEEEDQMLIILGLASLYSSWLYYIHLLYEVKI